MQPEAQATNDSNIATNPGRDRSLATQSFAFSSGGIGDGGARLLSLMTLYPTFVVPEEISNFPSSRHAGCMKDLIKQRLK